MQDLGNALSELNIVLGQITRIALSKLGVFDFSAINEERSRLIEWLGSAIVAEGEDTERVLDALQRYRRTHRIASQRQALLLCFATTQIIEEDRFRLIEETTLFARLLSRVTAQRSMPRHFRKCYYGLLSAYFLYDPDAPEASSHGKENHEHLRRFLSDHLHGLIGKHAKPSWLMTLRTYPGIFNSAPDIQQDIVALKGDWSRLEEIRVTLSIPSNSWWFRRWVMSQVKLVCELPDEAFSRYIESILLLLDQHPLWISSGLSLLLDRQILCTKPNDSTNIPLMEYAVAHWGIPWLDANAHLWQCGSDAKKAVARWMRRELLARYFSLLTKNNREDVRRAQFWDLYAEDITGIYLALGRDAFTARDKNLFRYRRLARGLIVRHKNTQPDLHVLILQLNNHDVIELSNPGNVAYFYLKQDGIPPFYFSKGWFDIGAMRVSSVKPGKSVAPPAIPLRHSDLDLSFWEEKFASQLGPTPKAVQRFMSVHDCVYVSDKTQQFSIQSRNKRRLAANVEAVLFGWGYAWSERSKSYVVASGPSQQTFLAGKLAKISVRQTHR